MTLNPDERPHDLAGVPEEEGISTADVGERLDETPEEQPNYPEQHPDAAAIPPPD